MISRRTTTQPRGRGPLIAVLLVWAAAGPASGRTIVLTDAIADRMAAFVAEAPLAGWASQKVAAGCFGMNSIDLRPEAVFLIRYPLEAIPPGMRITNAELMLPVASSSGVEPRLFVWRILPEWGVGACHLHRLQRPAPAEWSAPGARGGGDRAARPTAVLPLAAAGEQVVNVTRDVELWYTGASANNGWLFTTEDATATIRLESPLWQGRGRWKLRITYEPR
jgi:hypothetical protein